MIMKKFALISTLLLLLAGCTAGVNFAKPSDDKLVPGTTTKKQVISLLGEPTGKGEKIVNGEELDIISYAYANVGGEAVFEGVTPARAIGMYFHKGILVGREYTSSFKSDNTYFEIEQAKAIKNGMNRSEVTALIGEPGGEYIYPVVANSAGTAMVYNFVQTKGFKSQQSMLVVELDENGRVQKSELNQVGQLD